jgi:hypothetical protein
VNATASTRLNLHGYSEHGPDTQQVAPAGAKIDIQLGLLNTIRECSDIFLCSKAKDLRIELGLAKHCLKHCIKNGFIQAKQVAANQYADYLRWPE